MDMLLLCANSSHGNALKTTEFLPLGAEIQKRWRITRQEQLQKFKIPPFS